MAGCQLATVLNALSIQSSPTLFLWFTLCTNYHATPKTTNLYKWKIPKKQSYTCQTAHISWC